MAEARASLDERYKLRDSVRLRREAFGALLFDADCEALYVLRPAAIVPLLAGLDGTATLREAANAAYNREVSLQPSLAVIEQLMDWGVVDEV
jgi:putative mycofactocin binding protein MftB